MRYYVPFLFGVSVIFISSLHDPTDTECIFGRGKRSNNHVKLVFWGCTSKISCTYGFRENPQNSFHWAYRQPGATNQRAELPSLSSTGLKLKQLSGLATKFDDVNSQNFCAAASELNFFITQTILLAKVVSSQVPELSVNIIWSHSHKT